MSNERASKERTNYLPNVLFPQGLTFDNSWQHFLNAIHQPSNQQNGGSLGAGAAKSFQRLSSLLLEGSATYSLSEKQKLAEEYFGTFLENLFIRHFELSMSINTRRFDLRLQREAPWAMEPFYSMALARSCAGMASYRRVQLWARSLVHSLKKQKGNWSLAEG